MQQTPYILHLEIELLLTIDTIVNIVKYFLFALSVYFILSRTIWK